MDRPSSWSRVSCSDYRISGDAHCYRCAESTREAHKIYVYAYTKDCERGLELVTCNYDPLEATKRLGAVDVRDPHPKR